MADLTYFIGQYSEPLLDNGSQLGVQFNVENKQDTGTTTISVSGGNSFVRAAGWSGFLVGERLYSSGFTAGANNIPGGTTRVTAISGTTITVSDALTNESGTGDERVTNFPTTGGFDYEPTQDPNFNPNAGDKAATDATFEFGRAITSFGLDYGIAITNSGIEMLTWGTPGTASRFMKWNVDYASLGGHVIVALDSTPTPGTLWLYHGSGTSTKTEITDSGIYRIYTDGIRPILLMEMTGDFDAIVTSLKFFRYNSAVDGDILTSPLNVSTSDTSLSAGTEYFYVARVADEIGNTVYDYVSAVTDGALQLLPPNISPPGGTFATSVTVTLSSTESPDSILYTVNGTNPVVGGANTLTYSAPFALTATTTVRAIAVKAGYFNSAVASATFTEVVVPKQPTPVITPNGGTFTTSVQPTLASTGADAIYYTLDGSTPDSGDPDHLVTPVPVQTTTFTLKAYAAQSGYTDSDVATAVFTKITLAVSPPVIAPISGTFEESVVVTIKSPTADPDHVYVTTDGRTPTAVSHDYDLTESPWQITLSDYGLYMIKTFATKSGYTDSAVATSGNIIVVREEEEIDPGTIQEVKTFPLSNPQNTFIVLVNRNPFTKELWADQFGAADVSYEWLGASTGMIREASITVSGIMLITPAYGYTGSVVPNILVRGNNGVELNMLGEFPEDYEGLRKVWTCEVTPLERLPRE